jgi:hypothetical protein
MKNIVISGVIVLVVALLAPQITQAQGTIYLSNLGQPSAGSLAVGSDLWLAAGIHTGNNVGGYVLNSVQLGMTDASGNPGGFVAMLYTDVGIGGPLPGSSLGTLSGSTDPATGGIFTYTPVSSLTLSPYTTYFIVLTAGTAVANGAYEWSYAGGNSYNPFGGWSFEGFFQSSDGSSWNYTSSAFAQYAIDATAVPEPGVFGLFGLGGSFLAWHRRKAKTV